MREAITVTFPDLVVSSDEVAVITADPVAFVGAVYVALSFAVEAIFPRLAVHVTLGSKVPVPWTFAVHWLVCPPGTIVGLQVTEIVVMVPTETVAVPYLVESCVEVAVMVAVPVAEGVNAPLLFTVPMFVGLTDHVTAEL